jgi:hypothetical protein
MTPDKLQASPSKNRPFIFGVQYLEDNSTPFLAYSIFIHYIY